MVIEIADGKISGTVENGKPVPATLRNIVPLFEKRHRGLSVTMVGVEDILIDKITLRIASRPSALDTAFAALEEASGRKFRAQRFSESDFLLASEPKAGAARTVEIFNLSHLLGVDTSIVDRRIREMEVMLAVLRKQLGDDHGRVIDMKTELAITSALRGTGQQSPSSSTKVIENMKETVVVTLQQLKLSEPEFRFHPGTQLLVVIGDREAIDITRKVIAALEKSPQK